MPRDIPVGNGHMLVTFDQHYRVRDLYYPYVGQENHAGGGPCRFGVWAEVPPQNVPAGERRRKRLFWSDDGWNINAGYQSDTLVTDVVMKHDVLDIELRCNDVVDFHRSVLVRRIEVHNLLDQEREIRLFHHHDFLMYGTKVGDTAFYDPKLRSMIHYRKKRYIMACFYLDGDQQVDEYATGTAGFRGAEGTWRDAEDGRLGGNTIAQGAVDSTMMVSVQLPANARRVVYLVIGCGRSHEDMVELHRFLHREGPQGAIDRTRAYWQLWLAASRAPRPDQHEHGRLSPRVVDLFKRSLLVVRTQIDNQGAILAANDSDIMQFARDTYSYLWPRDGAFVADALDAAGFPDIVRTFFGFCSKIIEDGGYFLHKYNPDGSAGSSWHPWTANGRPQLPIQEDETALVIWALWRHYVRYRDIEFVRHLWVSLIQKAADFMVRFRDPVTRLPLPSYDLWEERWGVHLFTVASTYAGLKAAWQFAVCFGDTRRAEAYANAAQEMREACVKYMWSKEHDRFLRRIVPLDHDRTAQLVAQVMAGRTPEDGECSLYQALPGQGNNGNGRNGNGHVSNNNGDKEHAAADNSHAAPDPAAAAGLDFEFDTVVDSSMAGIVLMNMFDVEDEKVAKTMRAIEETLTIKTGVGGVARYEDDYYHQVSQDTDRVPGNPWFICTLWMADYHIARARNVQDLYKALPTLEWVAQHALESGILAEQVHPETGVPISVSPLTWSHATVVSTIMRYLARLEAMTRCNTCGQPRLCHVSDSHRTHHNPTDPLASEELATEVF